jgi:hypothetical protein
MVLTGIKSFDFRCCQVFIHPGWVETHFREDGSVSHFRPPLKEELFLTGMKEVGLTDPWHHGFQHELSHALIADALGWPHSWSVWASAHGRANKAFGNWPQRIYDEEHLVKSLQALTNAGTEDPFGSLQFNLGEARHSLAACLRRLTEAVLAG